MSVQGFVDETIIEVSSGDGGNGCVSFRREKYVPEGGPDGGDGGRGGDVIFVVRANLRTLANLRMKRNFHAQNGEPGRGRQMHGKNGTDIVIPVPPGTLIFDADTGEAIADLTDAGKEWVFLRGGNGGRGNMNFAKPWRQAPEFATNGKPGRKAHLRVELSLIADIGFVGFPNAGKSTLLSVLTNAHPEIASYPFTTKIPNLGMCRIGDGDHGRDVILADIPGLIEGASKGVGLGFRFLRHISRTAILFFLVDLAQPDFNEAFGVLLAELEAYSTELGGRRRVLVGTKLDLVEARDNFEVFRDAHPGETVIGISAASHTGLDDLKREITRVLLKNDEDLE